MGMSVDTLLNYKLLAEMIPELEELLDTGIVTKELIKHNMTKEREKRAWEIFWKN